MLCFCQQRLASSLVIPRVSGVVVSILIVGLRLASTLIRKKAWKASNNVDNSIAHFSISPPGLLQKIALKLFRLTYSYGDFFRNDDYKHLRINIIFYFFFTLFIHKKEFISQGVSGVVASILIVGLRLASTFIRKSQVGRLKQSGTDNATNYENQ